MFMSLSVLKHNMYQLRVMVYMKQQKHVTLTVLHVSRGKHMIDPPVHYNAGNTMWCQTNTFLCVVYVFRGSNQTLCNTITQVDKYL